MSKNELLLELKNCWGKRLGSEGGRRLREELLLLFDGIDELFGDKEPLDRFLDCVLFFMGGLVCGFSWRRLLEFMFGLMGLGAE